MHEETWSSVAWQPGAPTHTGKGLVFLFPKDHTGWLQWIKCSDHFNDNCFEPDSATASSLGLNKPQRRLKADTLPTIFKRAVAPRLVTATLPLVSDEGPGSSSTDPYSSQSKKVRKGAYENRERARVCFITIYFIM